MPKGAPEMVKSRDVPNMTPGRAALVVLMNRYGLELLATVHWVATREGADTSEKALAGVREWNDRKKVFTERQVVIAFDTLKSKGWLAAA